MTQSLFAELALKFSASPENLATEALCFILNRSQLARESFVRFLGQTGANLPTNLIFETQQGGTDNAIPDLMGTNAESKAILICESKFWAGLTDNQPVTYLNRLAESSGGILLFLAPSKRFPTLWPNLIERCRKANLRPEKIEEITQDLKFVILSEKIILALSSWRAILNALRLATEAGHDPETVSDILQLEGLCDRMDTRAFLPIRSEELAPGIGLRIMQYCDLVDEVVDTLVAGKKVSVEGLRATPTRSGYGRYMKIHKHGCFLQFDAEWWSTVRETPLWLSIWKINDYDKWVFPSEVKENLKQADLVSRKDYLAIPLNLQPSVEKDAVVNSLLAQLQEVIDHLKTIE